jgi:DNA polymerase/3'-5' exonuclease PolX
MTLALAQNYAVKIVDWLRDEMVRFEIAGSVRRGRPNCGDIDLVCIPKIEETRDLFGAVTNRRNLVEFFLINYAGKNNAAFPTCGPKNLVIQLPKCQLDIWLADEKTFATRLLCRTGSMQHNIWLTGRAKRKGWKWNPYEGILTDGKWIKTAVGDDYAGGHLNQFATEEEIYNFLDLPFIQPQNREIEYLVKHFGQ